MQKFASYMALKVIGTLKDLTFILQLIYHKQQSKIIQMKSTDVFKNCYHFNMQYLATIVNVLLLYILLLQINFVL